MDDQNERTDRDDGPGRTPPHTESTASKESEQSRDSLVTRFKALYKERPVSFALMVMGVSVVAFLLGTLLTGGELFVYGPPLRDPQYGPMLSP